MNHHNTYCPGWRTALTLCLLALCQLAAHATADTTQVVRRNRVRTPVVVPADTSHHVTVVDLAGDTLRFASADSLRGIEGIELLPDTTAVSRLGRVRVFNPDPTRALWLSALCPGLGQVYNRRYWKLPIVVGAFVGLSYGTAWNNRMLSDYSRAYRDAMDNDPDTRSYMDFYPPTVKESDLDMAWLQKALRNKRNYYRRYRDICIIGMVALYLVNIVDAYVDASLAHFDISPDLSMKVRPAVMAPAQPTASPLRASVGLQCAFNF